METHRLSRWTWPLRILKVVIVLVVAGGICHCVDKALDEIHQQGFHLFDVNPWWLFLAGLLYLAGMLPNGIFWHRVLRAMGCHPRWADTLRAYYIGHLGKYVPGKAMVVVLRTGLIRSQRVDTAVAAVSVFLETLTQMAVGAAVAATILAIQLSDQRHLLLWALAALICSGIPTLPPVFRWLVRLLRVAHISPDIEQNLRAIPMRVVAGGWVGMVMGWLLVGLSLWATLQAIPGAADRLPAGIQPHLLLTAAVALAVVVGFLLIFLPGGIGARELVLIPLLAVQLQLGDLIAVVAAVTLRLVWLVSELILSGILYSTVRKRASA